MLVDIIAIALLVMAVIKGFRNGLVVAVFSFLAFLIGMAAALKLSSAVAGWLGTQISVSERWLPVLAFFIVFTGVVLLVRLGAKALEGMLKLAMMGWLNRLGGILFYILLYFFIYSIILFYATQLGVISRTTAEVSRFYPLLYPLAPEMIRLLGVVLPFLKNTFGELEEFFGSVKM